MKKQIFMFLLLASSAAVTNAQNLPSGITIPLAASVPLVTLPASYTPPAAGFNLTRTFIPLVATSNPASGYFSLAPAPMIDGDYNCKASTTYINGWGTAIQTISRSLPGHSDIVSLADIRPSLTQNNFLPYLVPFGSHFQTAPFADQRTFYGTTYPTEGNMSYSQSKLSYGSSIPTVSSCNPGSSFVGNNNGNVVKTTINNGTEGIIGYSASFGTISTGLPYLAAELTIKTTTTPHGGSIKEFFDKDNREICKQVYGEVGTAPSQLITYYIYDEVGHLTYIITPDATNRLAGSPGVDISQEEYAYGYNAYGSVTERIIPGKNGTEFTIYDKNNRPVLYQTPLLKTLGQYKFNLYDSRDRVVISGILTDATTPATWQTNLYADPLTLILTPGTLLAYLINGVPDPYPTTITSCEIESVNFYDNYTIPRTFSTAYVGYYQSLIYAVTPVQYKFTQGLPTSSMARVRDGGVGPSSDKWVCSVFFYDQKGHMIQAQSLNPDHAQNYATCLAGAPAASWDVLTTQYSFSGQKLRDILAYNGIAGSDKPSTTIVNTFDLDMLNGGRVKSEYQIIDGGASVQIDQFTYDEFGKVTQKSLGGIELQNYDYSIRGQLTGINRAYANNPCGATQTTFGCIIDYDFGFTEPRYDGNICGIQWRGAASTTPLRAYGYEYDHAGRLSHAEFSQYCSPSASTVSCLPYGPAPSWNKNRTDFTVSNIKYDYNGNIQSMNQRGTTATGPVDMDILRYEYKDGTNSLVNVSDDVTTDYHLGDFLDVVPNCGTHRLHEGETGPGLNPCFDYSYDDDGNLASDSNKHIASIVYNENDQPITVTYQNGSAISNIYTAAGSLVSKVITPLGASPTTYRYCGPFMYQSTPAVPTFSLQYALHDEGRARFDATSGLFTYDYFVKDHLGNVRTVVTGNVTSSIDGIPGMTYVGYVATHEVVWGGFESAVFTNIDRVRDNRPDVTDTSNVKAARLNGSDSTRMIGTAIMLKVMAGDQFTIGAQSYWDNSDSTADTTAPGSSVLSAIISTLTGAQGNAAVGDNTGTQLVGSAFTPDNYALYKALLDSITNPDAPQAYINYLVFDEQMNLLPDQCGAIQVGSTPGGWQSIGTPGVITIPGSGYLSVYISNTTSHDVYIDPLVIGVSPGALIQEQHYYPFGLTINEGESISVVKNKFKYQGKELQDDLAFNLYDFTARQYDPQIGRFWGIDPANQFPSGYTGMGNNPANLTDPTGCTVNGNGSVVGDPGPAQRALNTASWGSPGDGGIDMAKMMSDDGWTVEQQYWPDYARACQIEKMAAAGEGGGGSNNVWKPLYKKTLIDYYKQTYGSIPTENQLGSTFEQLYSEYLLSNPLFSLYGMHKNSELSMGGLRNTVPDFIGNAIIAIYNSLGQMGDPITVENAIFVELKQKSGGLYLSSNDGQMEGHIENLAREQSGNIAMYSGCNFRPWMILVTTADVSFSQKIASFASVQGVDYSHNIAEYRNDNGKWQFRFITPAPLVSGFFDSYSR